MKPVDKSPIKQCPRCKIYKDRYSDFYSVDSTKGTVGSYCKACRADQWQHRNEGRRQYDRDRYHTKKAALHKLKDKPCADCGGSFPPCVMDFDHRDPTTKEFGVSQISTRSLAKLLAEAAKCDVVCANCHRIRTWGP